MPEEIYRLPDLPYDYGALEPHISARIMELHHDKHHAAYVEGANTALEKLHEARQSEDFDTITQLEKNLASTCRGTSSTRSSGPTSRPREASPATACGAGSTSCSAASTASSSR